MAWAGSSGTDIRGEAKLQIDPRQPNSNQAVTRTRTGEGSWLRLDERLFLGARACLLKICMIV
ncbi:hypothetical protein ACU18_11130 [Arthrobacter sp. ZBG10]|nr:hypothetical protein ACU18_11130 [Arthrobacter sp. ZBG10]KQR03320.1 hypothetical protein ASF72_09180 [Arthrobacter sp. Leaf141]